MAYRGLRLLLAIASLAACWTPRVAPRGTVAPLTTTRNTDERALPAPIEPAPSIAARDPLAEEQRFSAVSAAIAAAIEAGKMPGCVLIVGRHDEVILRRAYGSRALQPAPSPMTLDTVFDLASLTKPLATATSTMILVERGKIDLKASAARYVPELGRLTPFTVEQLLVHTSGLPAATPISDYALGDRAAVMRRLGQNL